MKLRKTRPEISDETQNFNDNSELKSQLKSSKKLGLRA